MRRTVGDKPCGVECFFYGDLMTWLCGGSPAWEKKSLTGSQRVGEFDQLQTGSNSILELVPYFCCSKEGNSDINEVASVRALEGSLCYEIFTFQTGVMVF